MVSNDGAQAAIDKASQTYVSLEENALTNSQMRMDNEHRAPFTNPGEPDITVPKEVVVVDTRNDDPQDQPQDTHGKYDHHQCGHEDNLMDEEHALHQPKQEEEGRKLISQGSEEDDYHPESSRDTLYRSHSGSIYSSSPSSVSMSSASSLFPPCARCTAVDELLHCSSSKDFWKAIERSACCERIWKHFEDKLKERFPDETALQKSRVRKLLKALLEVNATTDAVKISVYYRLIRFMGPFRAEGNRCVVLKQLEDLVDHSYSSAGQRKKNNKVCWFAGPMNREEANKKLDEKSPGTYLIRMSESEQDKGNFVLSLVMDNRRIDHFRLEGNPENAITSDPFNLNLEFRGKRYSTLYELVNYHKLEAICGDDDVENAARCTHVCADLSFHDSSTGYK